jgi:hypothetical protein
LFFYEAYEELSNETYLEYANGAVQWILSQAVSDGDGCKWPYEYGTKYYLLPLGMYGVHGPPYDVSEVLLIGYSITNNSTYLEYANKHANWVLDQAVSEGRGFKFPEYEGAGSYYYNAYINALTYRFLSEMYNVVGNATYSEYANGAFAWIVNNATSADGCYKWKTIDYYPYYPWWFMWGAAGIGYYLISAPSLIQATIDIDPDTLNLKSKGRWITCYIELPEGYNVSEIDVSTILLNDTIPAEAHPTGIGDEDEDGIPDLMVKFDRASVIDLIKDNIDWSSPEKTEPLTYKITLTVTGALYDGTLFKGSDVARVLKFLKANPMPI